MDDGELRNRLAEVTFAAAEDLAIQLGPSKAGELWRAVEAVARGEIGVDDFGELLEQLQGRSQSIN
jgi:hypothetical protein